VIIRTDPKTRAVMTASLVGLICVTATLGAVAMSGLIRRQLSAHNHGDAGPDDCGARRAAGARPSRPRGAPPGGHRRDQGLLAGATCAKSGIVGRRPRHSGWRSAAYHLLITSDGTTVSLPRYLERNPALQAWLKAIPLSERVIRPQHREGTTDADSLAARLPKGGTGNQLSSSLAALTSLPVGHRRDAVTRIER
jgi:hypothetical protein